MKYSCSNFRYEKLWDDYLSELTLMPDLPLCRYLRVRGVNVHAYENWMCRHGHSARVARLRAVSLHHDALKETPSAVTESSFVPVVLREDSLQESPSCNTLTGVNLTFPDGTVVSIRRGSAEAVVSFLKLYSVEGNVCSD